MITSGKIIKIGNSITPEYDHSYAALLNNTLEYLSQEWSYKPATIVSYGGVSGGNESSAA